jgi:hypothetical protein
MIMPAGRKVIREGIGYGPSTRPLATHIQAKIQEGIQALNTSKPTLFIRKNGKFVRYTPNILKKKEK